MGRKRNRLHPLLEVKPHPQPQLERGEVRQVHQSGRARAFRAQGQRGWVRCDTLVRPDCQLAFAKVVGQTE